MTAACPSLRQASKLEPVRAAVGGSSVSSYRDHDSSIKIMPKIQGSCILGGTACCTSRELLRRIAGACGSGTLSADTTRRCGDFDRPKFEFQVGLWLCFWPGRSTDSRDSDSELGPRYAKVTRMLVRGRAFFVVAEDSSFQVASCHDRSKLRGQRRKLHPPFVHLTRLLGTTVAQVKIGMCCRDVEG